MKSATKAGIAPRAKYTATPVGFLPNWSIMRITSCHTESATEFYIRDLIDRPIIMSKKLIGFPKKEAFLLDNLRNISESITAIA
jgi:hypothetical protein